MLLNFTGKAITKQSASSHMPCGLYSVDFSEKIFGSSS